jgi:hypothetical protein
VSLPTTDPEDESDKLAIFVEHYRRTSDAVASVQRAGMRDLRFDIRVFAERTLARQEVQDALRGMGEIDPNVSAPMEITRESLINDMQEIYDKALTDGQYASAIQSKRLQAHLTGHLVEEVKITHSYDVKQMTDAQLEQIARAGLRDVTPQRAIEGESKEVKDD